MVGSLKSPRRTDSQNGKVGTTLKLNLYATSFSCYRGMFFLLDRKLLRRARRFLNHLSAADAARVSLVRPREGKRHHEIGGQRHNISISDLYSPASSLQI
jgi:hypothetical protein